MASTPSGKNQDRDHRFDQDGALLRRFRGRDLAHEFAFSHHGQARTLDEGRLGSHTLALPPAPMMTRRFWLPPVAASETCVRGADPSGLGVTICPSWLYVMVVAPTGKTVSVALRGPVGAGPRVKPGGGIRSGYKINVPGRARAQDELDPGVLRHRFGARALQAVGNRFGRDANLVIAHHLLEAGQAYRQQDGKERHRDHQLDQREPGGPLPVEKPASAYAAFPRNPAGGGHGRCRPARRGSGGSLGVGSDRWCRRTRALCRCRSR